MTKFLMITVALGSLTVAGTRLALPGDRTPSSTGRPTGPAGGPLWVAANGVVEGARPEMALRPEISGTIATLRFRENKDVRKGTVLVELHNDTQKEQVALARAEVALAEAQLDRLRNGEQQEKRQAVAAQEKAQLAACRQAEADWTRTERLGNSRALSQERRDADYFKMLRARADLDRIRAERALIEAPARADEMAAARARVAAARARLRLAQADLAKTRLRAPVDGRILHVYVEPGEMAGPSSVQPILLLADLSRRRVRAFVEEMDVTRVRVGQQVVVTADALPGKEFAGTVGVLVPRMGKRALLSDAPGEYKDLYFREVLIDLKAADALPLNLRVQVRIRAASEEEGR